MNGFDQSGPYATSAATVTTYPSTSGIKEPESVVDATAAEVERLSNVISYAEERLSKVLSPDYADGIAEGVPTPVRSGIRNVQIGLADQIDRLNMLLSRVEA